MEDKKPEQTGQVEKSPRQLAQEAADLMAQQLTEKEGKKVHPIIFQEKEDAPFIVGYIKEPSRQVKLAILDKSNIGFYSAAAEMLDLIILKEHSDPRIISERSEDDKIYFGAVMAAYDLVRISVNLAEKKR